LKNSNFKLLKIRIFIIACFSPIFTISLFAQPIIKDIHKNYIFGMSLQDNGIEGPTVSFSGLEGKYSLAPGVTGGLLINHKFCVCINWQYLANPHPPPDRTCCLTACGQLYLLANNPLAYGKKLIFDDSVYFITPNFFVEMNTTKWIEVNVGAGFRFAGMVNGASVNRADWGKLTYYKSDYNLTKFSLSLIHWKVYSNSKTSL
jgi:hypothetical protein